MYVKTEHIMYEHFSNSCRDHQNNLHRDQLNSSDKCTRMCDRWRMYAAPLPGVLDDIAAPFA